MVGWTHGCGTHGYRGLTVHGNRALHSIKELTMLFRKESCPTYKALSFLGACDWKGLWLVYTSVKPRLYPRADPLVLQIKRPESMKAPDTCWNSSPFCSPQLRVGSAMGVGCRALSPGVTYVRQKTALFLIKHCEGVRMKPVMGSNHKFYSQIYKKCSLLPFDIICVKNKNKNKTAHAQPT